MEQNKMENNTLQKHQISYLCTDIYKDIKKQLFIDHPEVNKYEIRYFADNIVVGKIQAILCTLQNDAYENIVKAVHDKLNLDDLFDNRHKYLN
jgi:hypothetical protein